VLYSLLYCAVLCGPCAVAGCGGHTLVNKYQIETTVALSRVKLCHVLSCVKLCQAVLSCVKLCQAIRKGNKMGIWKKEEDPPPVEEKKPTKGKKK